MSEPERMFQLSDEQRAAWYAVGQVLALLGDAAQQACDAMGAGYATAVAVAQRRVEYEARQRLQHLLLRWLPERMAAWLARHWPRRWLR